MPSGILTDTQSDFIAKYVTKLDQPASDAASADAASGREPSYQDLAKSRLLWIQSRKTLLGEAKKLEDAIIAEEVVDEDNEPEDLDEVMGKISVITEFVKPFDGRLEDALLAVIDAQDAADRDRALDAARGVVSTFNKQLAHPFFDVVDTENGYTNVAIAATARRSMDEISKLLN